MGEPAFKVQVAVYRGHTHAEFAFLPTSPIAKTIGDWSRDHLAEKEYIPEGKHWDKRLHRLVYSFAHWEQKKLFCAYDGKTMRFHVPVAFCSDIEKVITDWGGEFTESPLPDYPVRKMTLKMNPQFTDRPKQVPLIEKCSRMRPGITGLNLQAGGGKTYIAVKTSVNIGLATLVIVPGLVEQWIDDIVEYTSAKKGVDVYKIEGFQSLALLAKNPTYKPSFFVASTRTVQMFSNGEENYTMLPWTYSQFCKEYGIGIKIVDECHKQFRANTLMDLHTNVPYNLYLSATFDQTSKQARKIFERIYPIEQRVADEDYVKYVTVQFMNFSGEVDERRCRRAKGYMHALYEGELLKSSMKLETHLNNVIVPLINQHYVNNYKPGHKCLVFCSTVEFVNAVASRLKTAYPNLKISPYISTSSRSVLNESDLVVSTIGKASTGLDWKGLHCCLNTVSVRSPVLTNQMLGRLRKINGEQLVYVDICDTNLESHRRHAEDRKRDLSRMAAHFYEFTSSYDLTVHSDSKPSHFTF